MQAIGRARHSVRAEIMQPNGVRCAKKCPAIQQDEIRKTRT